MAFSDVESSMNYLLNGACLSGNSISDVIVLLVTSMSSRPTCNVSTPY